MIKAAVALAEYHAGQTDAPPPDPPRELVEFWQFKRYQLPPNGGGLRDQPAGWLDRCETLDQVYRDWLAWCRGDKGVEWRRSDPDRWQRVKRIREFVYG